MRRHLLAAVLFAFFSAPALADDKRPEPHIVVQAQPLAAWLLNVQAITAKYPPALQKPLTAMTDSGAAKEFFAAIDKSKRFGLYVNFLGKIEATEIVFLLPVKDEKAFWKLMETIGAQVRLEKNFHEMTLFGETWYVRFRDGYANIARRVDSLGDIRLLKPDEVFDVRDKSLASVRGHVDKLPDDLRKQMNEDVAQFIKNLPPGMPGNYPQMFKNLAEFGNMILTGGRDLTIKLDLDTKSGELTLAGALTGKPGSDLEKYYGDLKRTRSRFAGLLGPDATAFFTQSYPLGTTITGFQNISPEMVPMFASMLQQGLAKEGINIAVEKVETFLKTVFACLAVDATDGAYILFGNKAGQYAVMYAMHIKDGQKADAALRAFIAEFPKEVREKYQLRTTKVDGVNLHRFKLGAVVSDEIRGVFGSDEVALAVRDDAIFVAFGAEGAAKVRAGLAATPQPAPLFSLEVAADRIWPLVEGVTTKNDSEKKVAKQLRELLGDEKGRTRLLYVSREGGSAVNVRVSTDLRALLKLILAIQAMEK